MPCQVGQNIYQLRKKNRVLLEQLESNSTLLESKIQRLIHATRSPRRPDGFKIGVQTSPKKRRRDSWNTRNTSSHLMGTLIRRDISYPVLNLNDGAGDHENFSEEIRVSKCKETPVTSIRHNLLISKPEIRKTCIGHLKARIQTNIKKRVTGQCYCFKMYPKPPRLLSETKKNMGKYAKNETQQLKNCKCLKVPIQTEDNVDCSEKCKCHCVEVSGLSSKSTDEAQHLLNYSPESVFLQQMKEKMQKLKNESFVTSHSKVTQICKCENSDVKVSDLNNHFHSASNHFQTSVGGDRNQRSGSSIPNIREKGSISKISENHKRAKCVKKSKEVIDCCSETSVCGESLQSLEKRCISEMKTAIGVKNSTLPGNVHRCAISTKIFPVQELKKCLCKKEVGGFCCCEVHLRIANNGKDADDPEPACRSSSKSSVVGSSGKPGVQIPRDSVKKKQYKYLSVEIQPAEYDDVAALMSADRQKFSGDSCSQHLEQLSHFRQKHWFDCHAHPHGVTSMELHSNSEKSFDCIEWFDDDPKQPTKAPCGVSSHLKQRLPELVASPVQRRLVTLPTVAQEADTGWGCDARACSMGSTFAPAACPSRPSRPSRPVPSNSWALRFQKGVA